MTEPGRAARFLAPIIGLLTGLGAAFHPAITSGFARVQISVGDPRLVNYILEHSWLWLTGAPNHRSFWSPPVFHPAEGVGAYSDTLVGAALLYWPFRALGAGPGIAFQLWMMACLAMGFLAAYAYLRRCLEIAPWPAAAGAFLYGFGVARLANFNSPQLFPVFSSMLALYALHRLIEEPAAPPPTQATPSPQGPPGSRWRAMRGNWALAFFGALVLQTWSAFYPAFFLIFALGLATLAALAVRDARHRLLATLRRSGVALGIGAGLALAAVAPMVLEHLAVARELGWRSWESTRSGLPTVASWLYSGERSLAWGALNRQAFFTFDSPASQHVGSCGFLTTLVFLGGLLTAHRRALPRVLLLTLAVLVVVTTRWTEGFTLWKSVYELVPGARAIRYGARFGILLAIPASIGVALALQALHRRRLGWLAIVLGLACGGEQLQRLSSWNEARYRSAVTAAAAEVDRGAEAFLLTTEPPPRPPSQRKPLRLTHVFAMWVGAEAGVPTVNGFYGNLPPGYTMVDVDPSTPRAAERSRAETAAWLTARGVAHDRVQFLEVPATDLPWGRRPDQ